MALNEAGNLIHGIEIDFLFFSIDWEFGLEDLKDAVPNKCMMLIFMDGGEKKSLSTKNIITESRTRDLLIL